MTLNIINKTECDCRLCGKIIKIGEYKAVSSRYTQGENYAHIQCLTGELQAYSIEWNLLKDRMMI
jgi:hypothetical protein